MLVLKFAVCKDGTVQGVKVLRELKMGLTEAATMAVRRWKYVPARCGDIPVPYTLTKSFRFTLDSSNVGALFD